MTNYAEKRRRRPDTASKILKNLTEPLGNRKVEEITRKDLVAIIQSVIDRGSDQMAGHLLTLSKQLFRYAISRGIIDASPAEALAKKDFAIVGGKRDRYLSDDEISRLFKELPGSMLDERLQSMVVLLLATGQRSNELRLSKWCDINFGSKVWWIPKKNAKNNLDHSVHLNPIALEYFRRLDEIRIGDYVLESTKHPGMPLHPDTLSKRLNFVQKTGNLMLNGKWSAHTLRHTAATWLGNNKVPPHVIERILNHATSIPMLGIYAHADYTDEMVCALDRWSAHLIRVSRSLTESNGV